MLYDAIEEHLPADGLFHLYHEYTKGTEVCPRFRFFAFAAALGALIKRNVHFQRSSYNLFPTLYPNLWVILVAPQGRGHKSAALSQAKKCLLRLPEHLQPRILGSKMTPEATIKALAVQALSAEMIQNLDATVISIVKRPAQALMYSSELGVLLGKEKYNQGMIPILTDLYDTPDEWHSETVMRGDQRLYNVCISIMGASTPDWMQTMLPTDVFKGGFMSRLFLVGYPETWNPRIADPPPGDETLAAAITERLTALAQFHGEIVWDKPCKDFFKQWYENLPDSEPGPKAAYLERKQDQLLRLAILIQLAGGLTYTLGRPALEKALEIIAAAEVDALRMVEYISVEPRMRVVQRILEFLEARKKISEGDLMHEVWRHLAHPREFDDVINMLLKTKRVIMVFEEGEVHYQMVGKEAKNAIQTHECLPSETEQVEDKD